MTRYARAGKGTHQRVAKDPTPWDDMKPPEPERVRGADNGGGKRQFPNKNRRKERFSKGQKKSNQDGAMNASGSGEQAEKSDQKMNQGSKKSRNANIRGFGESKSVKILGQFWVPLEDGKRLKNLLKKLKSQGLPRKEILEALKNERRKAEKASKRQRDKTCFQCRQFGHILTDCPNLRKASVGDSSKIGEEEEPVDGMSEGLVCFKCGSTEHTSRNCRRKGENFEFAKCFICSGSGHIARQCPKNSNGIYPSGGSCGECGSTTHLKKDCPDLVGVDNNHSSKNDDDAVTLRMSDPFLSTEYEPVFQKTVEDKEDVSQTVEEKSPVPVAVMKNTTPEPERQLKAKKKGKRKINSDDGPATFDFAYENEKPKLLLLSKPLFANPKRKVVKF